MASNSNKNTHRMINKLTPGQNLLWESSRMMLPEHKEAYVAQQKNITQKPRPVLDEQRLQEIALIIGEAWSGNHPVSVQLYDPFESIVVQGRIDRIHPLQKKLKLITPSLEEEEWIWVNLEDILDVTIE